MYGWPRFDDRGTDLVTKASLREGLQYALDLLDQGLRREPFHGYDLLKFAGWARAHLALPGGSQ
jgi:hypothetical protein